MSEALLSLVAERLNGDASIGTDAGLLVLAALQGSEELARILSGDAASPPAPTRREPAAAPLGAFLDGVTVAGFRGIGPATRLALAAGPGLTLVVGRNGSGKSSFAEGLEVLLTGDSRRWSDRPQVWREGWRNLHQGQPCFVEAGFLVEGTPGVTIVRREWEEGADLDAGAATVQPHGKPKTDLGWLGWRQALATHRPFLSYNELGSMLDEGPSKLYDALSAILGLEDLVAAEKRLTDERKAREKAVKDAKGRLVAIRLELEEVDDERARRCLEATKTTPWDLTSVQAVLVGAAEGVDAEGRLALLRSLVSIAVPDPQEVAGAASALREAAGRLAATAGTDADRARQVAGLLEAALRFHADHGDGDCPVCGRGGALEAGWRGQSEGEIERLRAEAADVDEAHRAAEEARRRAVGLLADAPPSLARAAEVGLAADELAAAWTDWSDGRSIADHARLADHLDAASAPLLDAAREFAKRAQAELDRREDAWRPMARTLSSWVDDALTAQENETWLAALKRAEKWLQATAEQIRNERFAPIAGEAIANWELLRTRSNVELGAIKLTGIKTRRSVSLEVTVDGVSGAALGVMSQGEINALALSLFLPRATLPESPFRFVVIDDPVQSMDPSRVEGLARVLERTAASRQVIVLTHDDRLPQAVRQLGIDATIIEVTRRAGSVVELREALDPVRRYLSDAFALVKTTDLPATVGVRIIPGLCRLALEAACDDVTRRRRLGRGDTHAEVEDAIAAADKLGKRVALALFDDDSQTGEVLGRLNRFGRWAGDVFVACNKGAHEVFAGDLEKLVKDTRTLARKLKELT